MKKESTFKTTADGWIHIAPHGTFPHPSGAQQVIDAEACEAMARTFAEEAKGANFPGLLVDFDHFSHDPAQASAAAGWLTALESRQDGLYGKVRWSDLGQQALEGGRYRLVSPVWNSVDCDAWTAPAGPTGQEAQHMRPRRLDRLALTNDPNLPGLAPLTNRREEGRPEATPEVVPEVARGREGMSLRNRVVRELGLSGRASDEEIGEAVTASRRELASMRERCARLEEAQAEADLARFTDVITNREVVRGQLLANRDSTLALLGALRRPAARGPLYQPGVHRPNLHLLGPAAAEGDPLAARRVANRARQLQKDLKIGHQAAFRLAEGEAAELEAV